MKANAQLLPKSIKKSLLHKNKASILIEAINILRSEFKDILYP